MRNFKRDQFTIYYALFQKDSATDKYGNRIGGYTEPTKIKKFHFLQQRAIRIITYSVKILIMTERWLRQILTALLMNILDYGLASIRQRPTIT